MFEVIDQASTITLLIALPVAAWMALSGRGSCPMAGGPRMTACSPMSNAAYRRYMRRFWPATGLYVAGDRARDLADPG